MSKSSVERAPSFDYSEVELEKIKKYFNEYDATDEKGRYLHWKFLKWRLPQTEAKDIWMAIKMKRTWGIKATGLTDDKENYFSYSMEAKLHQIIEIAGGNVAAAVDASASGNIQRRYLVYSLIMEEAITSAQLEGAATTQPLAYFHLVFVALIGLFVFSESMDSVMFVGVSIILASGLFTIWRSNTA